MSALIEEFKKEHSVIIEALKEGEELGVLTKEGHAQLMTLSVYSLNHLWNEDQWLYPVLRKESEHNKKLKKTLSSFINSLGGVHAEMQNFITKYYKGVKDNNFQREYERLFGALSKRIEYEENTLYDEYNLLYQ